jgi:NAD(P)H-hydrate repair Nnr-like enzyme with NAD(P)H-hydrate dehydratase domain
MAGSWMLQDAARVLRRPTPADDKYSRGVVGIRTGSDAYPGAAVLGVEAAWRAGVGMVRYLGPERATQLVLTRRPETVTADGRVQSWVIGSGMDAASRLHSETAAALDAVDVLKGAVTIVAQPDGWSTRVTAGTPWLATAGTGDVLAGVIGAVVAGGEARREAGEATAGTGPEVATAVWLHGRAATLAAQDAAGGLGESGPITALDVAGALPRAVAEALRAA